MAKLFTKLFCTLYHSCSRGIFLIIIVYCLSRQYLGQDYTQKRSTGAKVTLDQIDSVSVLAVR